MNRILKVGGFIKTSVADGPGVRSVLFLQGCSRCCEGCHNPSLQSPFLGTAISVDELMCFIRRHCINKRLTISGGEPMEQLEALLELISMLRQEGFDLCLYSGYEKTQIPHEIRQKLDYLKTGKFDRNKTSPKKPFVGSYNQEFEKIELERRTSNESCKK